MHTILKFLYILLRNVADLDAGLGGIRWAPLESNMLMITKQYYLLFMPPWRDFKNDISVCSRNSNWSKIHTLVCVFSLWQGVHAEYMWWPRIFQTIPMINKLGKTAVMCSKSFWKSSNNKKKKITDFTDFPLEAKVPVLPSSRNCEDTDVKSYLSHAHKLTLTHTHTHTTISTSCWLNSLVTL